MLYCTTHLTTEYLRVEKRVKYFAIPFFSLLSSVIISNFPIRPLEFAIHILLTTLSITLLWYAIRLMVFTLRRFFPDEKQFGRRVVIQVKISIVLALLVFLGDHVLYYLIHAKNVPFWSCLWDKREMFLTVLSFTFLVNVVYESFYLFLRLSEVEIESEHQKKVLAESQYHNLMNQLNPHFLFNSFNTLTAIIEEDSVKASAYVQELSAVYRYMLNSQKNKWCTVDDELAFARTYISLLSKRFEKAFEVDIRVDEKYIQYFILPLSLQLLIENALKHNELSERHPLHIDLYSEAGYIVVRNKKRAKKTLGETTRIGLMNISERYGVLCGRSVDIINSEEEFCVKIPLCATIPVETMKPEIDNGCCDY